jgi:hypothetical protein
LWQSFALRFSGVRQAIDRLERLGFAEFEHDLYPGNPIAALNMN